MTTPWAAGRAVLVGPSRLGARHPHRSRGPGSFHDSTWKFKIEGRVPPSYPHRRLSWILPASAAALNSCSTEEALVLPRNSARTERSSRPPATAPLVADRAEPDSMRRPASTTSNRAAAEPSPEGVGDRKHLTHGDGVSDVGRHGRWRWRAWRREMFGQNIGRCGHIPEVISRDGPFRYLYDLRWEPNLRRRPSRLPLPRILRASEITDPGVPMSRKNPTRQLPLWILPKQAGVELPPAQQRELTTALADWLCQRASENAASPRLPKKEDHHDEL